MKPKIGRPLSTDPRNQRVETKMTLSEIEKLDYCCEISGKTRSEIIREGIDIIYSQLQEKQKK